MSDSMIPELFKTTPFSTKIKILNESGRWISWNNYMMPEVFQENGYDNEVKAVHTTAVIEDKSPLTKYYFTGPDVVEFIDHLIPRDVSKIKDFHAVYTPICDHEGKMVMDGLLFRLPEDVFCYTAGCFDDWLDQEAQAFDVRIDDRSEEYGILHVQGPKSTQVLQQVVSCDLNDLAFSRGCVCNIGGVNLLIWRQGFTGEHGYELWVPAKQGEKIWDAIWDAGQTYGLTPFGHNSQDVARIEAGLILPALDYTCSCSNPELRAHAYGCSDREFMASPYELGLDRLIDLSKKEFVGKTALVNEMKGGGPSIRFVGIEINPLDIINLSQKHKLPPEIKRRVHRFPILQLFHDGDFIGHGSSVTWSPTLKKVIGFARIKNVYSAHGVNLKMEWIIQDQIDTIPVTVVQLPFIKIRRH